jgi:transcriptional regulator with PAS, ATPase and Fis domain
LRDADILSIKQRFGIIGNSPLLNHAIQVASQVAPTDMTVLITGESGSGKESFSKIIHHLSKRKHGQFIAINCGAIPEGTIDSELFGHEKGSFTGAHEARKGYFEVTNGGTIFLDEIGEMPLGTQARLLRVLENGEFIKVGSSKVQKTDVRVVAATNVDLIKAVEKGKFREDLYYRLNTVPIYVPPLRERGQDIELLFRKFAADFSEKYRTEPLQLTEDAKKALLGYSFPGNIRQLKNLAEQISVLEINRTIEAETLLKYLPKEKGNLPALYKSESQKEEFSERDILYKVLFDMKKDMNELKKLVHQMLQNEQFSSQILEEHHDLFENIEKEAEKDNKSTYLLDIQEAKAPYDYSRIEDIPHEPSYEEEENLSLEQKEKELIIRALKKNHNKRKYAAQDLGISERTLYRKIKQYEIDE